MYYFCLDITYITLYKCNIYTEYNILQPLASLMTTVPTHQEARCQFPILLWNFSPVENCSTVCMNQVFLCSMLCPVCLRRRPLHSVDHRTRKAFHFCTWFYVWSIRKFLHYRALTFNSLATTEVKRRRKRCTNIPSLYTSVHIIVVTMATGNFFPETYMFAEYMTAQKLSFQI